MRRIGLGLTAALALGVSGAAHAQPMEERTACAPPPPPQAGRPAPVGARPIAPACLSSGRGSGCRRGEVEHYNAEIRAYNLRVQAWNESAKRYVDALNAWTEASAAYAHCEIGALNRQAPR